jgi:hypothetical protein
MKISYTKRVGYSNKIFIGDPISFCKINVSASRLDSCTKKKLPAAVHDASVPHGGPFVCELLSYHAGNPVIYG